jgi:hypothetical protein
MCGDNDRLCNLVFAVGEIYGLRGVILNSLLNSGGIVLTVYKALVTINKNVFYRVVKLTRYTLVIYKLCSRKLCGEKKIACEYFGARVLARYVLDLLYSIDGAIDCSELYDLKRLSRNKCACFNILGCSYYLECRSLGSIALSLVAGSASEHHEKHAKSHSDDAAHNSLKMILFHFRYLLSLLSL